MATSIEDLLTQNISAVFNERDEIRRRAAIESIYAQDATMQDPESSHVGWDGIAAAVQRIQPDAPELSFSVTSGPAVIDDLGRVGWALGAEGAPPVVRGTDIAIVREGKIVKLYTFLEGSS
jgi:SnoaL-like domain